LVFAHKGNSVFIGDDKGKIHLLNIESWVPLMVRQQLLSSLERSISSIDCTDGDRFIVAQDNGKIMEWEMKKSVQMSKEEDAFSMAKEVKFMLIDTFNLMENPFDLNEHELEDTLNQEIYSNHCVFAKFISNDVYSCCSEGLQCMAFRNVLSHKE